MAMSAYNPTSSSTSTSQAATTLLGMPSSLRAPSHMVLQTLANRLPGAGPWKQLALAAIQDANQCGRDVSVNANAIKSVLASMDSKNREIFARAADEVATRTPLEMLNGVGGMDPMGKFWDPLGFATDATDSQSDMAGQGPPVRGNKGATTPISEGRLLFYREAELKHGRLCMLASLGILVAEKWHPLFPEVDNSLPAYVQFQATPLQNFWILVAIVIAVPEVLASIPSFKGTSEEGYFEMKTDRLPGDFGWDPLGLKPKEADKLRTMQNKEINNGRLAMIATAGMIAQEQVTNQKIF